MIVLKGIHEHATLHGHSDWISAIAIDRTGKTLASGSHDNTIKLWDLSTFDNISTLTGHEENISAVAFSPNSRLLASGSYDARIKLWDVQSKKMIATLRGHKSYIYSIVFSPDGKILASSSYDDTIIIWDLASKKPINVLKGYSGWVTSIAFSTDGSILACGGHNGIKLVDSEKFQEVILMKGHEGNVYSLAFNPDSSLLVSGGDDNTVRVWDANTGEQIYVLEGHKFHITSVAFDPTGHIIISNSYDNSIRFWDVETGAECYNLTGYVCWTSPVVFNQRGNMLIFGDYEAIKILDVKFAKIRERQKVERRLEAGPYAKIYILLLVVSLAFLYLDFFTLTYVVLGPMLALKSLKLHYMFYFAIEIMSAIGFVTLCVLSYKNMLALATLLSYVLVALACNYLNTELTTQYLFNEPGWMICGLSINAGVWTFVSFIYNELAGLAKERRELDERLDKAIKLIDQWRSKGYNVSELEQFADRIS